MRSKFETKAEMTTTVCVDGGEPETQYQEMNLEGSMNLNEDETEMEMSISGEVDSHRVEIRYMANVAGISLHWLTDNKKASLELRFEDEETLKSLTESKTLKLITESGKEISVEFKTE